MRFDFWKKLPPLVVPHGLLLAAVVIAVHVKPLADSVAGLAGFYPVAVLTAGVLLGWRFHRSRVLFALFLLAVADRSLLQFAAGGAALKAEGRVVFQSVALLLPLNLAVLTLLPERGILTPSGLRHLGTILVQVALVALLYHERPAATAALLQLRFLPGRLSGWTPLGQLGLLAFAAALVVVVIGYTLEPRASGRAFFWALPASFLGLSAGHTAPVPTLYFATAGLFFVVAVIEASYFMAFQDTLTGLPGRRAFNDAVVRLAGQYAVAMVDIDHFKDINDRYGHDVGDQVLRMVAAKLAQVPGGGRAYRYGGEEFAIVISGKTLEECIPNLEVLRELVEETVFTLRGRLRPLKRPTRVPTAGPKRRKQVAVTVSIGVAEPNQRHPDPDQVVRAADAALYRAKEAGRNQVKR